MRPQAWWTAAHGASVANTGAERVHISIHVSWRKVHILYGGKRPYEGKCPDDFFLGTDRLHYTLGDDTERKVYHAPPYHVLNSKKTHSQLTANSESGAARVQTLEDLMCARRLPYIAAIKGSSYRCTWTFARNFNLLDGSQTQEDHEHCSTSGMHMTTSLGASPLDATLPPPCGYWTWLLCLPHRPVADCALHLHSLTSPVGDCV